MRKKQTSHPKKGKEKGKARYTVLNAESNLLFLGILSFAYTKFLFSLFFFFSFLRSSFSSLFHKHLETFSDRWVALRRSRKTRCHWLAAGPRDSDKTPKPERTSLKQKTKLEYKWSNEKQRAWNNEQKKGRTGNKEREREASWLDETNDGLRDTEEERKQRGKKTNGNGDVN